METFELSLFRYSDMKKWSKYITNRDSELYRIFEKYQVSNKKLDFVTRIGM